MAASERAFGIPELTNSICGYLNRGDCARLLRVSCCLFCYVRPFVWEDVIGATHVLRLLPGIIGAGSAVSSKKIRVHINISLNKSRGVLKERSATYAVEYLSI